MESKDVLIESNINVLKTDTLSLSEYKALLHFIAGDTKELVIRGLYTVERLTNAVKIFNLEQEIYTHIYQCHLPRDIERITHVICDLYDSTSECIDGAPQC